MGERLIHKAEAVDVTGRVSALCFMSRRAIDLKKATWTLRDEAVTCPKCLAWITRSAQIKAAREGRDGS